MTTPHRSAHPRRPRRERAGALGLGRARRARSTSRCSSTRRRRRAGLAARGARRPRRSAAGSRSSAGSARRTSTASSRSASATGSRSRSSRGSRKQRPAGDDRARRRVRARLPERVRPLHRQPLLDAPPARPQRQLPRLPPAAAGRRRLLALPRRGDAAPDGSSDPQARLRLAAKMVGRWPSGAPLALAPDARRPELADANDFGYHERRPPRGRAARSARTSAARTRATRSTRARAASKSLAINRRHRLLRRGREYGPAAARSSEALRPSRRQDRARAALHLPEREHRAPVRVRQPHLAEQPEVRRALRRRRPVTALRRRTAARSRSRPTASASACTDVPRFVSVRGGAYFFLPGLAALRYLADRELRTSRRPSARSARSPFICWRRRESS